MITLRGVLLRRWSPINLRRKILLRGTVVLRRWRCSPIVLRILLRGRIHQDLHAWIAARWNLYGKCALRTIYSDDIAGITARRNNYRNCSVVHFLDILIMWVGDHYYYNNNKTFVIVIDFQIFGGRDVWCVCVRIPVI
jgi:hypothetical protein